MKTNLPAGKHTVRIASRSALVLITAVLFSSVYAHPLPASSSFLLRDTILVQKQITSKKYKIKLYPNANQQVLFFSASGEEGKIFQLFLFDIDGRLVKQANIKNRQTTVLNKIEKGNYLFEVFSNDERIENGQLIVR